MTKKRTIRNILFLCIIIFIFNIGEYTVKARLTEDSKKNYYILVNLNEERLYLIDKENNVFLKKYAIASGKSKTPSPIGTWKVTSKFRKGGVFGSRWIGLNCPWGNFGIHGTNKPETIGYPVSHGCIRMHNKDIEELYDYVIPGMIVNIYGGPKGPFERGIKTLKPGDRGAAVFEVQRKMKEQGYYPGNLDGIYGKDMKRYVRKFREDNNLKVNHNIDYEFYRKLGLS